MRYLEYWNCGEFSGTEIDQLMSACMLIEHASQGNMPYNNVRTDVVAEDFELTQLVGGRNLLSPVRINAVLDWECHRRGLHLQLQARQLRTSITRDRLKLFGFQGTFRKDEFAAMQHAVTWLRRTKAKSREIPWKLSDGMVRNANWDCACMNNQPCDLNHT